MGPWVPGTTCLTDLQGGPRLFVAPRDPVFQHPFSEKNIIMINKVIFSKQILNFCELIIYLNEEIIFLKQKLDLFEKLIASNEQIIFSKQITNFR